MNTRTTRTPKKTSLAYGTSVLSKIVRGLCILMCTSCASGIKVSTQKLDLKSGNFGVPDTAIVRAVSLIRFDEDNARYDGALSLVVQRWLGANKDNASAFLQQVSQAFSDAFVSEVEAEVRRRKCIYTVVPKGDFFLELVNEDFLTRGSPSVFNVFETATNEELDKLEQVGDEGYDREYARLLLKYEGSGAQSVGKSNVVAIASDCLLGVHAGTTVDVFKFNDLIAISPRFD